MCRPSKRARVAANLIPKKKESDPYFLSLSAEYERIISKVFEPYFDDNAKLLEFLISMTKVQLTKARARPYDSVMAFLANH